MEYSTSSGAKRGYIIGSPNVAYNSAYSSAAKVTTIANVYYGTDASKYEKVGAVYADETVALLAKNSYWAYIEYNTTAGRKRGYVYANTVQSYNTPSSGTWGTLYTLRTAKTWHMDGTYDVYSGPYPNSAKIGSVSNEDVTYRGASDLADYVSASYIEYTVDNTGKIKSGFILNY